MSLSPGIYVTKPGISALTNTNPKEFIFNSNYDTYKFLQIINTVISITDFGGTTPTTKTQSITLPPSVTFAPYFFSYIVWGGALGGSYDFNSTNASTAYIEGNPSGGNVTAVLNYLGGGTSTKTVVYDVYIFGNAV